MKNKTMKVWAVICSRNNATSAFETRESAIRRADFLDGEYGGYCKHKVVQAELKIIAPKNKKKPVEGMKE